MGVPREAHVKTCPDCNGDGVIEKGTDDEQQCPTCGGSGFVPDNDDDEEEVIRTAAAFPPAPNWGPKGVRGRRIPTAERLSRRSRLPGAPHPHDLLTPSCRWPVAVVTPIRPSAGAASCCPLHERSLVVGEIFEKCPCLVEPARASPLHVVTVLCCFRLHPIAVHALPEATQPPRRRAA
jgi:hypothetical protein